MKRLFFFLLLLSGCGFSPLYSETNSYLKDTQVSVLPIPNRYGDKMRRVIEKALFTNSQSPKNKYRLFVAEPSFSSGDKTITSDEFASTMQVTAKTTYQLDNATTGKTVYKGTIQSVSSYSVVRDPYATTVAKNHIQEELAQQLAQQISLDVLAQLSKDEK